MFAFEKRMKAAVFREFGASVAQACASVNIMSAQVHATQDREGANLVSVARVRHTTFYYIEETYI